VTGPRFALNNTEAEVQLVNSRSLFERFMRGEVLCVEAARAELPL
jgi:hypothetical protein